VIGSLAGNGPLVRFVHLIFWWPAGANMLGPERLLCLDVYILKPLWLLYLILAGIYLYEKELLMGLLIAAMGFLFGVITRVLRRSIPRRLFARMAPSPLS